MATINPSQDYDAIHTLTFAEASGTCKIRLYRGSSSAYSGTVYYREGTSGAWTQLDVSGTDTTFSVTSTTMQIGHSWNKSGNNYMTPSFYGQSTNLTNISISQKAVLSGSIGTYFMVFYARDCSKLTSLDIPDTSSVTGVGNAFMGYYANGCTNLTSLSVPDTSSVTSAGDYFIYSYAYDCTNLTSLSVPDTSSVTGVGNYFMDSYAIGCSELTSLDVPDTSSVTSVGNYFMRHYAYGCTNLTSLSVPDTSSVTSVGYSFMYYYAYGCTKLTSLILPAVGWFANHDINWSVPSGRLNYLKGYVTDSSDLTDWQDLTTSTSPNTLYINYIRSTDDVVYIPTSTSTSTSTSSSSSSSTSSSSTTTEQLVEDYSRGDYATLNTDDADLENLFTEQEYEDVSAKDNVYVAQTAVFDENAVFLFKNKNDNTTDSIQVTWDGKSEMPPFFDSTVYLQVYNRTTEEWETKDSDNSSAADTNFELTATITTNLNDYYDVDGWVSCRVYQEMVSY